MVYTKENIFLLRPTLKMFPLKNGKKVEWKINKMEKRQKIKIKKITFISHASGIDMYVILKYISFFLSLAIHFNS